MPVTVLRSDDPIQFWVICSQEGQDHFIYLISAAGRARLSSIKERSRYPTHEDACNTFQSFATRQASYKDFDTWEQAEERVRSEVVPVDTEFNEKFYSALKIWEWEQQEKEQADKKSAQREAQKKAITTRAVLALIAGLACTILVIETGFDTSVPSGYAFLIGAFLGFFYEVAAALASVAGLIILIKMVK